MLLGSKKYYSDQTNYSQERKEGRKERSCQVCSPSLFLKVFKLKPRQNQDVSRILS